MPAPCFNNLNQLCPHGKSAGIPLSDSGTAQSAPVKVGFCKLTTTKNVRSKGKILSFG